MSGDSLNGIMQKRRPCVSGSVSAFMFECHIFNTPMYGLIAMNDLVLSLKWSGGKPPFTQIGFVLWPKDDKENES